MLESNPQLLTALLMLGLAGAFIRADPAAATSRALAVALASGGIAVLANDALARMLSAGPLPEWTRALVLPEVVAFCAVFEWVQRIRRKIPAGTLKTRGGDWALRVAQGLAILYGIDAALMPELRVRDFYGGLASSAIWSSEVMALFVAPLALAMLFFALSIVLCLNRDPEPAERIRLIAFLFAIPVVAAGLILPRSIGPATTMIALATLVGGTLRYAELRGRQGEFMSRFLSPQVAALVNRDGLRAALREERRDVSIVSIDLRGFTAFVRDHGSEAVIQLLRDYYDAVGSAVLEFDGTIKDYAGDGVLILVGAPVAAADHPRRALALARRLRAVVTAVANSRGSGERRLGVGIGVASGPVTLGIVGGNGPFEYAAVGQAVNLAARLCEHAAAGEILVAEDTGGLLGADPMRAKLETRPTLTLKGFAAPVPHYALAPA